MGWGFVNIESGAAQFPGPSRTAEGKLLGLRPELRWWFHDGIIGSHECATGALLIKRNDKAERLVGEIIGTHYAVIRER